MLWAASCRVSSWERHSSARRAPEKTCLGLAQCWGLEDGAGSWVSRGGAEQAGERWLLAAGKAQWSKGTFSAGSPQKRRWVSQGCTVVTTTLKYKRRLCSQSLSNNPTVSSEQERCVRCGLWARAVHQVPRKLGWKYFQIPLFHRLKLENWYSKYVCFLTKKTATQPSASWRSGAAPGELRGQQCRTPAVPPARTY